MTTRKKESHITIIKLRLNYRFFKTENEKREVKKFENENENEKREVYLFESENRNEKSKLANYSRK